MFEISQMGSSFFLFIFLFSTYFKYVDQQLFKIILILDKLFLKYEVGGKIDPLEKTTLKTPSLFRVTNTSPAR